LLSLAPPKLAPLPALKLGAPLVEPPVAVPPLPLLLLPLLLLPEVAPPPLDASVAPLPAPVPPLVLVGLPLAPALAPLVAVLPLDVPVPPKATPPLSEVLPGPLVVPSHGATQFMLDVSQPHSAGQLAPQGPIVTPLKLPIPKAVESEVGRPFAASAQCAVAIESMSASLHMYVGSP